MLALNISAVAFVPPKAPTKKVDTTYGTTKSAKCTHTSDIVTKFQTKYKTELCKNWIEVGYCRYKAQCMFAHGHSEVVLPEIEPMRKDKNCKTFFKTG